MPKTIRDPAIINPAIDTLENITGIRRQEASFINGALRNAILDSANSFSIVTDAKGIIQFFNVGAEHVLGYAEADVINKITPAEISDPQEMIAYAEALSLEFSKPITPGFEALAFKASRGIEDIYELTYIRKDGSRFPAVVSVTALRDARNAIVGYHLIGTDNAARKQANEARQTSEARLSGLVSSILDAVIAIDSNQCIIVFNPAAESMFGLTSGEMLGLKLDRLMPSRFRSAHSNHISRFGETNLSARNLGDSREIFGLHADGGEFPIDASIAQFEVNGEKMFTVVLRDITERKRMHRLLQEKHVELEAAKSVAEKANVAKSEFLSSMSHELRTPLNTILGFAQLMESGSPPPTPSQKIKIDQILRAGWYLLELINEILDLALIESGRLSLSIESVPLAAVMRECEAMIEPQTRKHGVSVAFPRLVVPYFVKADRTRVKQVLINLLSNAIKYNRVGGSVTVENVLSHTGSIRISVRDTGEGLTPEQLAQLFQPFNRLGQEANAEQGTGIGLVVSKRLVEWMGGVIGVESTVGKGSVFWIELNLTTEPQVGDLAAEPTLAALAQVQEGEPLRTLLYVEDNPANLLLVEDIIARRCDIRLLTSRDGNSGIELARASQPDVILMDINLPGISGIDAMKILAADQATAHIPVIALSANAILRDIEKGLEAGFFRYLTKPIKVNEFMATLDVAMKFANEEAARAANPNKQENASAE